MRALLLVPVAALALWAGVSGQEDPAREIMWRKLDLSHDILDALALEDFEALEAWTEEMNGLALSGAYNVLDTEEYRAQSDRFRFAVTALGRAARDRNAKAGALAYVDLTLGCIRCHQSLGVEPR